MTHYYPLLILQISDLTLISASIAIEGARDFASSYLQKPDFASCCSLRKMEDSCKGHVVCLPFPAQGHINPMLQFSKRLVSKGLRVTLISLSHKPSHPYQIQHNITVITISDGFEEGEKLRDSYEIVNIVQSSLTKGLPDLLNELKRSEFPPKALVYDSTLPWALDIARNFGLYGAVLFTQPWFVNVVYYHVLRGAFCATPSGDEHMTLASLPSLPMLSTRDLPSFVNDPSNATVFRFMINQFSNIEQVDMVLCNTFDKLEEKVLKWMESLWPFKNIGPTIPSMYLDKRLGDDKDYGLNLFNPESDRCLTWLDSKRPDSVVYVSFGSAAILGDEQMKELAAGLKQTGHFFLWVVRETEKNKLPRNYSEEISENGLIVTWSPQLEVLAHKSVGCFVTHCGWNSTTEALCLEVPMVGVPQWADQPTNAKFIEDVWKVGVRVKSDKDGFVTKEEIVRCVLEVMEGEKSKDIRRNAEKWKDLAIEAVSEGGSSDRCIDEFVREIA